MPAVRARAPYRDVDPWQGSELSNSVDRLEKKLRDTQTELSRCLEQLLEITQERDQEYALRLAGDRREADQMARTQFVRDQTAIVMSRCQAMVSGLKAAIPNAIETIERTLRGLEQSVDVQVGEM